MSQGRIDRLLEEVRTWNDAIESYEDQIGDLVHLKNEKLGFKAEALGRIAFLEGRKRSRNPFSPPHKSNWNNGYDAERAESLEACRDKQP